MDEMTPEGSATEKSLAWWRGALADFFSISDETIIGKLASQTLKSFRINEASQLKAWCHELEILRRSLAGLADHWRLLLEYPLLRLGRRLDAVLLTDRAIFVLEFKTLNSDFSPDGRIQVEDYAHDLRDFHSGSRDQIIVPILIAGSGHPSRPQWEFPWPGVTDVYEVLPDKLAPLLKDVLGKLPARPFDIEGWEYAAFKPVPTIIEAARALYDRHGVAEIKEARADTINLSRTTAAISRAIREAQAQSQYVIVFVTGIPGAGKTLCGLDVVFSGDADATFLTGTLPMVYVLKAALAEDTAKRQTGSKRATDHKTKAKIESVVGFVRDNIARAEPPHEHVIVFDEAQRAWDAEYGARKFDHTQSEAAIMLDVMRRHKDYAVIVALVGHGQEINTGEAGLEEWGNALLERPAWQIHAAPGVLQGHDRKKRLFDEAPANLRIEAELHLDVPIRNIRSPKAAGWIDASLRNNRAEARDLAGDDLPIYLTRSLAELKVALRAKARGQRRAGLVCSSGAKRLIAEGVWPGFDHQDDKAVANWFLKNWPADVRASDALELPATEFACQGLEVDYVGLCWGGDLLWQGKWVARRFRGTDWQIVRKAKDIDYVVNKYRVLLTRARADTIIWVPEGDARDRTRKPGEFDEMATFLLACGVRPLGLF
jgi:hypothetical protein